MSLQLEIIIFTKEIFKPLNSFFGLFYIIGHNLFRHFTSKTCCRDNKSFMIFFEQFFVDTGTHIITFCPSVRNHFDKVFIPGKIFGQNHQVPTTHIRLAFLQMSASTCNITFATYNGLKLLSLFFLYFGF